VIQEGAFLVRVSETGGSQFPFALCILHKGETYNIKIRKRDDNKFALGNKKDKETVSYCQTLSQSSTVSVAG